MNGNPLIVPGTADEEALFSSIDFTNDYMFMTVLSQHPEICIALLRCMLPHISISHIQYKSCESSGVPLIGPNVQQTITPGSDMHGVRLDVFYDDGKNAFDVEMHNGTRGKDPDLLKRTRYSHGAIDGILLKHGENYRTLRPCYVIYLCTFDPFGRGLFLYTAKKSIREDPSVEYEDGDYTLYFNARGAVGEAPEPMKEILRYINKPKSFEVDHTDVEVIKVIDEAVRFNQRKPEWRLGYRMFSLVQQDAIWEGRQKGLLEGRQEGLQAGLQAGDKHRQRSVVLKLLRRNRPIEEIAEDTELPLDEVLRIKREHDQQQTDQ